MYNYTEFRAIFRVAVQLLGFPGWLLISVALLAKMIKIELLTEIKVK